MAEISPNIVQQHECVDWDDFVKKVREQRMIGSRMFRGQRDASWVLSSPWERILDRMRNRDTSRRIRDVFAAGAHDAIRDGYLRRFKNHSIGTPGFRSTGLEENDWWAIGRHHGLTTPILDWTKSPFVAAFFAFLDYADDLNPGFSKGAHDGAITFGKDPVTIWELTLGDNVRLPNEFEIFSSSVDLGHRQEAQQGLFTRLSHDTHLDVEAYLCSRGLAHHLCRYEISGQSMGVALGDLDAMTITPATMFPDLDGAASMANLGNIVKTIRSIGK